MRQFGSPEQWIGFIESQVPAIIDLVIAAWEVMPAPAGNELEDAISKTLCCLLRQSRNRCDLPFRIDTQLVELEPAAGEDQGRLDIVFSPTVPREDLYFCLECKRLNVREADGVRPYFAEYVRFGMLRFVRGQYAHKVRFGGMLAFVLDGDVTAAIIGVERNIRVNHLELRMTPPGEFRLSAAKLTDNRVRETVHGRDADPNPFVIQHLFMAGDPTSPLRPPPSPPPAVKPKPRRRQRNKR